MNLALFPAIFRFRRALLAAAVAGLLLALALWQLFATRQEVTLLAWEAPGERGSLDGLLREFERRNWRVKISLETAATPEAAAAALRARVRNGKVPDAVFLRAEDLDALLAEKALRPFAVDADEAQGQITALRSAFERGGKTWALPFGWSVLMLYHDRGLFEACGIPPPKEFWDWGDLLAAAQALILRGEDGRNVLRHGLALEGSAAEVSAFLWQNRGQITDEKGAWTLTDPRFVQSNEEALSFYASLVSVHRVAPLPGGEKARTLFASKKAAMAIGPRRWAADLAGVKDLDWDIAPLPKGREPATVLDAYGCAVPRGAAHPEVGARLATFLARETSQAVLALRGEIVPSRIPLLGSKVFLGFPTRRPARNDALVRCLPFAKPLGFGAHSREASALLAEGARELMSNPSRPARAVLERMQEKLEKLDGEGIPAR
ncbi:MAG: extracellular solute-binding protein [Verrucomicrobiia bacterium]